MQYEKQFSSLLCVVRIFRANIYISTSVLWQMSTTDFIVKIAVFGGVKVFKL